MNKFYIVENLEFDPKFKTEKEIEDLKFKRDQAIGVWSVEAETEDERINNLLIRFKTTWESILHLFHTVTTDPTR